MLPGSARGRSFAERVEILISERPDVAPIVRPMLAAWSQLREQIRAFDKAIRAEVKQSRECRLLMSVPDIGPVTVLAYVSAIEHPDRFRRSRLVGAHLGLTPRQYQSGDVDRSGHISKCVRKRTSGEIPDCWECGRAFNRRGLEQLLIECQIPLLQLQRDHSRAP